MAMAPSSLSPSSSSHSAHFEAAECTTSNYDEFSMHKSVLFMDSLQGDEKHVSEDLDLLISRLNLQMGLLLPGHHWKLIPDLKKLRTQLYSAAEYFEFSYADGEQKQIVVDTLKDYIAKALVNTVDHLGSMSYKVNGLLNENMTEISSAELQMDCIQQRIQMCQAFTDREGLVQQCLSIKYPIYHKHYVLPKDNLYSYSKAVEVSQGLVTMKKMNDVQPIRAGVRSTARPPTIQMRSSSPSPRIRSLSPSQRTGTFGIAERKTANSLAASHPLARSVSQKPNGPADLSSSSVKRWPSHSRRSTSMQLNACVDRKTETEQQFRKSKSLLKSLLSIRR